MISRRIFIIVILAYLAYIFFSAPSKKTYYSIIYYQDIDTEFLVEHNQDGTVTYYKIKK